MHVNFTLHFIFHFDIFTLKLLYATLIEFSNILIKYSANYTLDFIKYNSYFQQQYSTELLIYL